MPAQERDGCPFVTTVRVSVTGYLRSVSATHDPSRIQLYKHIVPAFDKLAELVHEDKNLLLKLRFQTQQDRRRSTEQPAVIESNIEP
ncbi:unnamed protein product [Timema podura]|uniref:Uncharacterized protein n=1 Tax=Timema podura TaxID=61482 RepID=A0ABN7NFC8_TIMPD|nr:unnamed protein product [Timema podura]